MLNRRLFLTKITGVVGGVAVGSSIPESKPKTIARVNMDAPGQKYQRGDRVHITKDMPGHMSHFHKDMDATVQYTYAEAYGNPKNRERKPVYSLDIDGHGKVAWYDEHLLTPIFA